MPLAAAARIFAIMTIPTIYLPRSFTRYDLGGQLAGSKVSLLPYTLK